MLEAKSIYRGGDIVLASECDYDSSRKLGLICPFCDSAVFLRSEGTRVVNGKEQHIKKHFVHYPTKELKDCEKRYLTKEGRKEIERIKYQARNQRLLFFNKHLWEIVKISCGVTNFKLNKVRSLFGEKWVAQQTRLLKFKLRDSELTKKALSDAIADVYLLCKKKSPSHYILKCDLKEHVHICSEVASFLSTDTGDYALQKILKVALYETMMTGVITPKQLKKLDVEKYLTYVCILIAGTEWLEIIETMK